MPRKKSDRDLQEERTRPTTWTAFNWGAAGADTIASKAAEARKRHIVYGCSFSGVEADIGIVAIKVYLSFGAGTGTTLVLGAISNTAPCCVLLFPQGIRLPVGMAANAVVPALGASVVANASIWGITVDDEESL